jgi:hypothetical protein
MTFPLNCLILLLFMPQQLDLRRIVGNPSRTATITPRGLRDLKPQRQAGTRRTEAEAAIRTRTLDRARVLVNEIIAASYPELKSTAIRIKLFESKSDYFKARFGVPQFFLGPMQYLVFVNPRVFKRSAPDEGVRAIVAHELGHVLYFKTRNRLKLLGLVRLASKTSTHRFERWADLQAISRGYGEGLKEYRQWLYKNIPASKLAAKRLTYFSPDEIDAILFASRARPDLLGYWLKNVPLNLNQIVGKR